MFEADDPECCPFLAPEYARCYQSDQHDANSSSWRGGKHPAARAWLAKHARSHLHFTPTSSSWLNLVERWFRDLTDKAIQRGIFPSVPTLITTIEDYLQLNNRDPKPFVWTATVEAILEKVQRGQVALQQATNPD